MGPKPTTPLDHAHDRRRQELAAADRQHRSAKDRRAHPAKETKRRAARRRRGLRGQRAALSPRAGGLRRQASSLRPPGPGTDPVMAQMNRDAAREGARPARDADFYRQHPDLVPPQAVRAQMREDELPVEVVDMDPMPIEADLSRGEKGVLRDAGHEVVDLWMDVAKSAADGLFRELALKALQGQSPGLLDKAQDAFFDMLPGPVGKIRHSMESMAKAGAPKPAAQAAALVAAYVKEIDARKEPLYAYVDHHQLQAAKMVKDRDGKIGDEPSAYHALWRGAPFFLPGPDANGIRAKIDVRLQALYYQAMAQATCAAGAGTPGLCMPERLADPARWREDAERAKNARDDGKVNFAEERMGW